MGGGSITAGGQTRVADLLWAADGGGGGGGWTPSAGPPPSYQASISEWKASATESAGSWKLELCEPGWLGDDVPGVTGGVTLGTQHRCQRDGSKVICDGSKL